MICRTINDLLQEKELLRVVDQEYARKTQVCGAGLLIKPPGPIAIFSKKKK